MSEYARRGFINTPIGPHLYRCCECAGLVSEQDLLDHSIWHERLVHPAVMPSELHLHIWQRLRHRPAADPAHAS